MILVVYCCQTYMVASCISFNFHIKLNVLCERLTLLFIVVIIGWYVYIWISVVPFIVSK